MKKFVYTLLLTTALAVPMAAHADVHWSSVDGVHHTHHYVDRTSSVYTEQTPVYRNSGETVVSGDRKWDPKLIQALQQSLKDSGFYKNGVVTGIWDNNTTDALASYQASKGMRVTGSLDNQTALRLGLIRSASDEIATTEGVPHAYQERHMARMEPVALNDQMTYDRTMSDTDANRMGYHTTYTTLTTSQVETLQQSLADSGFYKSGVDGVWGPSTTQAIRNYQASNGLAATGRLNGQTLDRLGVRMSEADQVSYISPASGQ